MKKIIKFNKILLLIFAITTLFYIDSFTHFFYQDDWWHFYISSANNLSEFISFFNPLNSYQYQIYRPLSTQVFFFTFQKLFGYNHTIFQAIVIILLSINSYLIYLICLKHTKKWWAFLLAIYYIVHHQNIGIIYYLSTIQTSIAVLFSLLSFRNLQIRNKHWRGKVLGYFILSLLSHEATIINSLIFTLYIIFTDRKNIKKYLQFILLLSTLAVGFLLFRFYFINTNFFINTHYNISLNPKTIANNLMWYILWLFSIPEYIINFVGSGFMPLPPLFGIYRFRSITSLIILLINVLVYVAIIIKFKLSKKVVIYWSFFVIALAPVLIFPWHKYTYYLPFATSYIILGISILFNKPKKYLSFPTIILFVLISTGIITNIIDRQTSSSYERGVMSEKIKKQINFSQLSSGPQTIFIANDPDFAIFAKEWGSTSTQAKIVLRDDLFLKLLSGNKEIKVMYQDDDVSNQFPQVDYTLTINKNW